MRSLKPAEPSETVVDLLAELSQARKTGNVAAIVRLSESLTSLDKDNGQSWLALAKAWASSDSAASNGLAAAVRSSQLAKSDGDKIEALLLASSNLRSRLERERALFDAAKVKQDEARLLLEQASRLGTDDDDFVAPDPNKPNGRIQTLQRTREQAEADMTAISKDVAETAAFLDDVYREIQTTVPPLAKADLKGGDKRLNFRPLVYPERNSPVDYQIEGADIRVCIRFDRALNENSREYSAAVKLSLDSDALPAESFDARAEGSMLCLLRLRAGKTYSVQLLPELAAADGSRLGPVEALSIQLPELPQRIGFGDGEFILPRSGRGELPVSLTNIEEEFPIEIHRLVDRSLYRHLALGHIRNGIPNREYQALLKTFSEVLWTGMAKRKIKPDERNTTVQTFVPVRRILDDRDLWLRDPARKSTTDAAGISSIPPLQPVADLSDPLLSINGTYLAGAFDTDSYTSQLYVPGVYALVAPIDSEGPEKKFHCTDPDDTHCEVYTAQWFVISDIGLSFYEGQHDFSVVARSLKTGEAVEGATVQLVAQSNRLLAEAKTDEFGVVHFPVSLTRGTSSNALVAILADTDKDFNFLQFGSERLDLSRLNVGNTLEQGREAAFIYTDRGIYQPGEQAQVFSLLRDRTVANPANVASELRLEISDYPVLSEKIEPSQWAAGAFMAPIKIPAAAKPGPAMIALMSGDQRLAESRIEIGPIKPDRVRLDFGSDSATSLRVTAADKGKARIEGQVRAQYLYGSEGTNQGMAAGLKAEVMVRVSPQQTPPGACHGDLSFGEFDDKGLPTVSRSFIDYTDENGVLALSLDRVTLPISTKPLAANVEVTLFDSSGPLASGQFPVPVPPSDVTLGISALPRVTPTTTNSYKLDLDLAIVGRDGSLVLGRDLVVTVWRERESYSWENVDGVWQHVVSRPREPVATREIRIEQTAKVFGARNGCAGHVVLENLAPGLSDGRYIVSVKDKSSSASASVRFNTGVAQTSVEDLEPNLFVLSATKERYEPGEDIELLVDRPFESGKVLIAIADGDVLDWSEHDLTAGKVTIKAKPEWAGKGLHALATAFRAEPGGQLRQIGPARAIGATYFEVANASAVFGVSIRRDVPLENDYIRPGEPLTFEACLSGQNGDCVQPEGQEAFAVAFVVDEGLLGLTNHAARFDAIATAFFGREKMSLRIMDNYGRLLREGGDRPGRQALSNYSSRHIVAAGMGPVKFENGRASFTFASTQLQTGSLKVYVVAWSTNRISTAVHTVAVRNLLVTSLGTPEFLLSGDKPILPLRIENLGVANNPGDYALTLKGEGGIAANITALDGTPLPKDAAGAFLVSAPQGHPKDLSLRLEIPQTSKGAHELALDIAAVGQPDALPPEERRRTWTLDVRPSAIVAQETLPPFPLGSSPEDIQRKLEGVVNGRYDPATVQVVMRMASKGDELRLASSGSPDPADAEPVLDKLTWLGMVGLQTSAGDVDAAAKQRVQADIEGIQALQMVDGVFVPYRTDGEFLPTELGFDSKKSQYAGRNGLLRNASALDFLIRAQGKGYAVSEDAIRNSLAYISARIADAIRKKSLDDDLTIICSFEARYAMLLLAQEDRLDSSQLEEIGGCGGADSADDPPSEGVFSQLVTLAVQSQYGKKVNPAETLTTAYAKPSDYLGDLDDYRKAVALSMLANADADAALLKPVAESFLKRDKPLDLKTRGWLARSIADLKATDPQPLKVADLELSEDNVVTIKERGDGILESDPVAYSDLHDITVARISGPDSQAFFTLSGNLIDADGSALPPESLRRRFFRQKTGKEIDISHDHLSVGERIVVVVEANASVLGDLKASGDLGASDNPLMLEALLPSAFTMVSPDLSGIVLNGDLRKLEMLGSVRSMDAQPQGWKSIVVPDLGKPTVGQDAPADDAAADDADESEVEEDGEAAAGPEQDGADISGSETEVAPEVAPNTIVLRQGFIVSVAAAGSFLFPPTTIERLDLPGDTLISQQLRFEVDGPGTAR
ncbi:hypothetical protein X728_11490 [Mesorhizobium sp. L103C120A0]|nr:hypothetical protein X728_11490 [Mesorhizobium sp. L103C120A0]